MKVASDLDGVIAFTNLKKDDFVPFWLRDFYKSCTPTKYAKMRFDYVITGRKEHFRKLTENWLEKFDVKYGEMVMYPNKVRKSMDGIFKYKAKVINDLDVGKYYENHEGIYNYLKENCRKTEIVFVDGL